MRHVSWLEQVETIDTGDRKRVLVFRYNHVNDNDILDEWAKHFRNHYCSDTEIDSEASATGMSKSDYLLNIKFPSRTDAPGPSVRAGDFGEILVADYLQFVLGYDVPRTRYEFKSIRNESTKGIDVVGFRLANPSEITNADELFTFEVKCSLTSSNNATLQNAIDDSKKDFEIRKAESLAAMKIRLRAQSNLSKIALVERFQNQIDRPYRQNSGAAAVVANHVWSQEIIIKATAKEHPNRSRLTLIVIKGDQLMNLVHNLYDRACDFT
ncbi:Hachiman antiphage defense system protein HamA [Ohtaekwangia kribbensis]|uniref:Hachiman antiphage defense system protein HamA n=1 Tax=Ohtaekwangia kribbensis TaxID=688913 RepID=A0ABW3K3W6_9BACT